jgi:hypothetical protein
MRVAVTTGANFSAGRPERLLAIRAADADNGPNYDISRDGKWFVVPGRDEGRGAAELHLVLNWFREVKARTETTGARAGAPQLMAYLWRAQ